MVRHNYFEYFNVLTGGLGVKGTYTFQINGMFDPNISGVGHQPIGFDQMSAMYGRYNVVAAKIKLKAWTGDVNETMCVGLVINEESNLNTYSPAQLIENGSMSYRILPTGGTDMSNQQVFILTAKVSVKKKCKVQSVIDYDNLGSNPSSNPLRALYAHIIVWQPDNGQTTQTVVCHLEMEQVAVWTRPITIGQS